MEVLDSSLSAIHGGRWSLQPNYFWVKNGSVINVDKNTIVPRQIEVLKNTNTYKLCIKQSLTCEFLKLKRAL